MTKRILLVDDEAMLRSAFRALLESAGYDVIEAGTAEEAIARVRTDLPDLVFLDLGLPDRPGLDVARQIMKESDVTVVALTGRSELGLLRACRDAGCAGHLIKPVSPRDLVRGIPGWLGGSARGDRAGNPA